MDEQTWDKKLNIVTVGRDDKRADAYRYPYEPTPYEVLARLSESGYINHTNNLVDYGCGKGRVGFFLNETLGCRVVGIEYDERIYEAAKENWRSYMKSNKIKLLCETAEDFIVTDEDCFYFFNPFSVEILKAVVRRILDSFYGNPRTMRFFFYYPNDEYLSYLLGVDELVLVDQISCLDLFEGNDERERILVFEAKFI